MLFLIMISNSEITFSLPLRAAIAETRVFGER